MCSVCAPALPGLIRLTRFSATSSAGMGPPKELPYADAGEDKPR